MLSAPARASTPVVRARTGEGFTVDGEDLDLQLRGRAQLQAAGVAPDGPAPVDPSAQVRRLRVAAWARWPHRELDLYLQLGFAAGDLEPDLPVPLRDAVLTWAPLRDLGVRLGQGKVPYNLERMVSSAALQFVDRSATNAALNLDRDVGLQLFSEDLGGLDGRIAYTVGVFNGDGRNRDLEGTGLLSVARVELRPFGAFDDDRAQVDLLGRQGPPRAALGLAVARNARTLRERSTTGAVMDVPVTFDHAAVDLVVKAGGWSLHGELLGRRAAEGTAAAADRSGWGYTAMTGLLIGGKIEPALRWAELRPLGPAGPGPLTEARGALSWYIHGHDLKVQADVGRLRGPALGPAGAATEGRLQAQAFF